MIREVASYIAEILFRIMDGAPLMNSGWLFLYIALVISIFSIPL